MNILNKKNAVVLGLSSSLLFTSCEAVKNSNNTQRGVAIGAASGAVIGGILGNKIVGGAAGGIIGNKMDKQAREIKTALPGAEVERVNEGIKVTMKENMVNFAFNSSELSSATKTNLDKLAKVLVNNPDTNINIYGHTDNKGTDAYNMTLSEKRAKSVVNYLASHGVKRNRMFAKGMGESDPVATNETEAGRAENRRVEFAITANEKMIKEAQNGN